VNGGQVGSGDDGRLSLSGVLSFATVPEVWAQARPLIEASPRLSVDLGGVTRADSAGLALLVECLRAARQRRKEIVFVNMPDQMLAVARVSGLDRVLPCSPEVSRREL
jgi:phospholipid transport system transporter-binding protein